jgi:ABC-2 type transport system permease protein
LQAATVATEAGRALFALVPRGLPSVLLGAVTAGISLPALFVFYPLGAVFFAIPHILSVHRANAAAAVRRTRAVALGSRARRGRGQR